MRNREMQLQSGDLADPAATVREQIRAVTDQLTEISELTASLLRRVVEGGARPARADLAQLEDHLRDALSHPERPMDGIGVATVAGYLSDNDYWLEWWRVDPRGGLEFVTHMLNPQQDSFYDYPARAWFTAPVETSALAVTGPYVDAGGTNAYTVTAAVPVVVDGATIGVAGADIYAFRFESTLLLARAEHPLVLANASRRVIASTTPAHLPGDLLADDLTSKWRGRQVPFDDSGENHWVLYEVF
ncbi:MAG: cache domain-containing protein [Leucobacter sp.]